MTIYGLNFFSTKYTVQLKWNNFLKVTVFICLFGFATCGLIPSAPLVASPVLARISDDTVDPNPSYSFAYDVQDALTGDSKGQIESRANGIVQGIRVFFSDCFLISSL